MTRTPDLKGSRPNILFILADDLSYRDLSCFGQLQFQTPTLDRLCAQGVRFDEAYSGSPECAPARASVITGMHMGHCSVRMNRSARGQDHLQASDVTVAEVLKSAGYATCMVGKWGCALPGTEGTPDKKGFDVAYGFYDQCRAHTYYPHYLYENGRPVAIPENYGYDMEFSYRHTSDSGALRDYDADGKLSPRGVPDPAAAKNSEDLCYEKALAFIDDHHTRSAGSGQAQPMFLYYATQLPHGPVVTPDLGPYKDKPWSQKHQEWAGMIRHLDNHVAGLLDALESCGQIDNTLIVFASDNGYAHWGYMNRPRYADDPIFRNKGPWKGGKFISWEGGVRVPLFVSWPGRVAPGNTRTLTSLYDLLATFADFAGAEAPPTDGISLLPLLSGREADQQTHEFLYWENCGHAPHAQAARMGRWFAWREHPDKPLELWDTIDDVASERDVAAEHPDVVQRVLEIFAREHVDSEWFLNPGESDDVFDAKSERAKAEGSMQNSVRANTEYRGDPHPPGTANGTDTPDPNIPD